MSRFMVLKTYIVKRSAMKATKQLLDDLTYEVIGAAIEVHKALGPGLLESVYHYCMMHELQQRKLAFSSEHRVPIHYKTKTFDTYLRCDLLVEDLLVVELKSVAALLPLFSAQVLTYMQLLGKPKGILINFNVTNIFHDGQRTLVNEQFKQLPDQ